jgi:hypothetical protein
MVICFRIKNHSGVGHIKTCSVNVMSRKNTIFIFIQLYYITKNSNTDQLCLKYLALNIILINVKMYKILNMYVCKRMEQWFYLHRYYGQR